MSITAVKVLSISTALIASGGIATLSLFDIPELQSQPASRSLPSIRWLFSRGSHIFPAASTLSSAGFAYLAYNALPATRSLSQILKVSSNGSKVNGFLAAAVLAFSIAPWTQVAMVPTNFELIRLNTQKGGARSEKSSKMGYRDSDQTKDIEPPKGGLDQFTDLSGPQAETDKGTSSEDDRKVKELLGNFGQLNAVRAILLGAGGILGLWTALAL